MNNPAKGLFLLFGAAFLLFAGLAFWVAIATVSPWPLLAGIASSFASYVGFRAAAEDL